MEQHYSSQVSRVSTARIIKQIGLAGLAKTAAWIDGQIRLAGLTKLAGLATCSREREVPVRFPTWKAGLQKIWLTWKVGLHRIRLTQKFGLHRIRLTRKTELCKTQGTGNQKKEKVLLQAKCQQHGGVQGVLPRQKKCRLQKMHQRELVKKKEEEERHYWFNHLWPMTKPKQTWRKNG
jgi:hypothetical protein